jgi:hypothetical protein
MRRVVIVDSGGLWISRKQVENILAQNKLMYGFAKINWKR